MNPFSHGPSWSRRAFLTGAAGSATYSLLVRAPQTLAAVPGADFASRETVGARIDTLAPDAAKTHQVASEPNMRQVDLEADLLVAGGGLAGVCAALAAARQGARVILAQDRSRLGGNASSEVRMHPMGSRFGFREGGLIEELSLENAWQNEHYSWELWDLILYDKVVRESNIKLLLDTTVYRVEMEGKRIQAAWARCDKTEHLYRVRAPMFMDATGDGKLGLEAGAEFRYGREGSAKYGESLADYDKVGTTQGSSILFTSRKHARPMSFEPPPWARKLTAEDLAFRNTGPETWSYGYWWIELGGVYDTIRDNERLRFELLAVVLGVWDFIKNSGKYPEAANWALETVGMLPGKRDSRRFLGDYLMTQHDLEGKWKEFPDAVAFGGWPMDDHPALGFDAKDQRPFKPTPTPGPYNIAFGSLYARNVDNLLLAGRNISASHVAFSSIRVMKTCAVIGEAAGLAGALCAREGITPRELRQDPAKIKRLQQELLRGGALILDLKNEDPADLARQARVRASGAIRGTVPDNIQTGKTYNLEDDFSDRWVAPLEGAPAWIEFSWERPVRLREVQLTHDTGMHRGLTMAVSPRVQVEAVTGPQPETARDYRVVGVRPDGSEVTLASVLLNYQRVRRHRFDPVELKAVRVVIESTHGMNEARLYEVRAYA